MEEKLNERIISFLPEFIQIHAGFERLSDFQIIALKTLNASGDDGHRNYLAGML